MVFVRVCVRLLIDPLFVRSQVCQDSSIDHHAQEIAQLEMLFEHSTKVHDKRVTERTAAHKRLADQIAEKANENERIVSQLQDLQRQVEERNYLHALQGSSE
jgi:hypothetical protein